MPRGRLRIFSHFVRAALRWTTAAVLAAGVAAIGVARVQRGTHAYSAGVGIPWPAGDDRLTVGVRVTLVSAVELELVSSRYSEKADIEAGVVFSAAWFWRPLPIGRGLFLDHESPTTVDWNLDGIPDASFAPFPAKPWTTWHDHNARGSAAKPIHEVHSLGVAVPHWAGAVGFAALVAAVVYRRRRRHPAGHCSACGYDLRATPDRCPECGTTAD